MPTLRNPFRKNGPVPGLEPVHDENNRPIAEDNAQRASLPSSKSSTSILSIKSKREEPNEYKLSGKSDLDGLMAHDAPSLWVLLRTDHENHSGQ